jgi:hypothetical protein
MTVKEKIEKRISLNEWCLLTNLIQDENNFLRELLKDLYAE